MDDAGDVAIFAVNMLLPDGTLRGQSLAQLPDLEVLDACCSEVKFISEADIHDL